MNSVEKEKIILHALTTDAEGSRCTEFYTIDMRKGQVSKCPNALLAYSGLSTMVYLGSTIYLMGSLIKPHCCKSRPPGYLCATRAHFHKHMSYLDLDKDTCDGWKEAPWPSDDGLSINPVVLEFGGKIYLFQLHGQSKVAHVFDPLSNQWETLLPPPSVGFFHLQYAGSAVADPQNKRILLHFETIQSVFAYYPANNQWELVLKHFSWSSNLFFGDGVFFGYLPEDPEFVMAYHVATRQRLNIVFTSEFPDHVRSIEFNALLHLGSNLMCFVAYSYYGCPPPETRVYLAKFRFELSPQNPTELLITPLPEETYTTGACSSIKRFLPI